MGGAVTAGEAPTPRLNDSTASWTATHSSRCRPSSSRWMSTPTSGGIASAWPWPPGRTITCSSEHRRAARSPSCCAPERFAVISGHDYVTPEDVKAVAPSALAHRVTVKPELWLTDASGSTVAEEVLATVPTPTPGERRTGDVDRRVAPDRRSRPSGRRRSGRSRCSRYSAAGPISWFSPHRSSSPQRALWFAGR